ncbi:MAG: hypothetical protein ACLS70_11640 [[Clostridium] symbiosum]
MDRLIPSDIPWLRGVTGAVQISFMFGIYTVMASGAGTLIESQTGSHLARILGSAVFCAIVTVISLGGVEAVVKTFGRVVPVLVTLTIVTALIVIGKNGIARIEVTADAASNPLLGNWGIAAANFTSYNFFCALGALAPLGWPTVQGNRPLKRYYGRPVPVYYRALSGAGNAFREGGGRHTTANPDSCRDGPPASRLDLRVVSALCNAGSGHVGIHAGSQVFQPV